MIQRLRLSFISPLPILLQNSGEHLRCIPIFLITSHIIPPSFSPVSNRTTDIKFNETTFLTSYNFTSVSRREAILIIEEFLNAGKLYRKSLNDRAEVLLASPLKTAKNEDAVGFVFKVYHDFLNDLKLLSSTRKLVEEVVFVLGEVNSFELRQCCQL